MSTEDIIAALASAHPADLVNIRHYIAWIKIRRRVNNHFYFQAHWITRPASQLQECRVHWVG
jgi:hypothetical protein